MPQIKSLTDVIKKGPTPEDKCTNALVWLLQRCSFSVVRELLALSGIEIGDIGGPVRGHIQEPFPNSRPDALLEFKGPIWVLVESKIHPGTCSISQLQNHYKGAIHKYGGEALRMLLLSVERKAPDALSALSKRIPDRVYYLSWQQVLHYLDSKRVEFNHEHQVYLDEFFAVLRDQKLWRLFSMTIDELRNFLTHYTITFSQQDAAKNLLVELLSAIRVRCVASTADRAEDKWDEEGSDDLPCLYTLFKISKWHTNQSAYTFLNAAKGTMGVILTGYQDDKRQQDAFSAHWHSKFKEAFASDPSLQAFTWVDADDDNFAGETGYFKEVAGTSGHSFDPLKIELFKDNFYWDTPCP
jgi:hypothetical protein